MKLFKYANNTIVEVLQWNRQFCSAKQKNTRRDMQKARNLFFPNCKQQNPILCNRKHQKTIHWGKILSNSVSNMSQSAGNPKDSSITAKLFLAKKCFLWKFKKGFDKKNNQKNCIALQKTPVSNTRNVISGIGNIRNSLCPGCVKSGMACVVISGILYIPTSLYPFCVTSGLQETLYPAYVFYPEFVMSGLR